MHKVPGWVVRRIGTELYYNSDLTSGEYGPLSGAYLFSDRHINLERDEETVPAVAVTTIRLASPDDLKEDSDAN